MNHASLAQIHSVEMEICEAFRIHQQRARFVGRAYDSELSLLEALTLAELEVQAEASAQDLLPLLKIDKSNVSRMLSKLEKLKYISIAAHATDRRRRVLMLAVKGRAFLRHRDLINAKSMSYFLQHLDAVEQSELATYLKVFADNDGAQAILFRPSEHPILIEMRRLALSLDVYRDSFYGSGEDCLTFHLLSEIARYPNARRVGDLSELFGIPLNSMSQILTRLESRSLLVRTAREHDARVRTLKLTSAGQALLRHVEKCAYLRIHSALTELSSSQVNRFVALLKRYVGLEVSDSSATISLQTKELKSEEERAEARAFHITQLTSAERQYEVQSCLFPATTLTYALYRKRYLVAVVEIEVHPSTIYLSNFSCAPKELKESEISQFLNDVIKRHREKNQKALAIARSKTWAAEILITLGGSSGKSDNVRMSFPVQ